MTLISPDLATICEWNTLDDTLNSDHLPIVTNLYIKNKYCTDPSEDKIPKYNYKLADWIKFSSLLATCSLSVNDVDGYDVETAYTEFTKTVLWAADNSIPRSKPVSSKKHSGNIWWNTDCETAKKKKKLALKVYLKEKNG